MIRLIYVLYFMNNVCINTPSDKSMHPYQDFVQITHAHFPAQLMYQNFTSLYKQLAHVQLCFYTEMITSETCYITVAFAIL